MKLAAAITRLRELETTMHAYQHAMDLLYYDGVTTAPAAAFPGRGETLGTLSELSYRLFTSRKVGELLSFLEGEQANLDDQINREVRKLRESYDRQACIPEEEFSLFQELLNESEAVWRQAKADNQYDLFEPYLNRVVEYSVRFAKYYDDSLPAYHVLLQEYEKGTSMESLDRFFADLRTEIVPLVQQVLTSSVQIDDSFLYQTFPVAQQRELADYVLDVLGVDRSRCALGETEHPFTLHFNKDDVRITTHYEENNLVSSLYSVLHEAGHALYELSTAESLRGTCLAEGTSMGIHESQSRFWENIIGRSLPFIRLIYPKIQSLFPRQMAGVSAEQFYRAVNKSVPSLIRTESDELTYSLHIMVRYELEKRLVEGNLHTKDLPAAWNRMYQEYLGIDVPDDARGVLQDSHWSGGNLGYFPSYALGSAYSAQMLFYMEKDLAVWDCVSRGELLPIWSWLEERIYRFGSALEPGEVLENCCGGRLDSSYYVKYLKKKYGELYHLQE